MNERAQQLQVQLASAESDEERISLLLSLSADLHRDDPESALRYAKEALALAASHKDRKAQAASYRLIGTSHLSLAHYSSAFQNFNKAVRLFESVGDEAGKAHALSNIGAARYHTGEYREALEVLNEALEIARRLEDTRIASIALTNLGVVYEVLGDYKRALECHHQSMDLKETMGRPVMIDLMNIGTCYFDQLDLARALDSYKRCLELHRTSPEGDRYGEGIALMNIGATYQPMGELELARQSWQDAFGIFEEVGDRERMVTTLQYLSEYHRERDEFDISLDYLGKARTIAEEIKSQPILLDLLIEEGRVEIGRGNVEEAIAIFTQALETKRHLEIRGDEMTLLRYLAEAHAALGDFSTAFARYKEHVVIRDELLGIEQQKAIKEMEIRVSIERSEKEREILRLNNERLEVEMDLKTRELTTLAMQLVQKNEFLETLGQQVRDLMQGQPAANGSSAHGGDLAALQRQIDQGRNSAGEWETFERQFHALHPGFVDQLAREHPTLWPTELKVCALLKLKMSTKDVAAMLCCSTRTVEDHRYRIRTKLGLGKEVNLSTHLAGL